MLAGLLLLSATPSRASHAAPPAESVSEYESNLRFFYKTGQFQWAAEARARWEYANLLPYRDLTLGPYYRLHKNLKVGAFYRIQQGARHDDDWVEPRKGEWIWQDTSRRSEHVFILDATPRMELPIGSRGSWVGALKNQYLIDTFNNHRTYKLRPELNYFWMKGLNPFMNFFVHYEVYFPLNYGVSSIYETWLYTGGLYHYKQNVSLGGYLALRDAIWGSSADWKKQSSEDYRVKYKANVIGLLVIFEFSGPKAEAS